MKTSYSRETHPWFPPTPEADLQKKYVVVIAAVLASVAAQAAGASKQNEEGSIEHTVKSMLKMNLKKAGCDERPWPVSKQMKTILILQLMSEAEDLALKRYTEVVAQDFLKNRMAK